VPLSVPTRGRAVGQRTKLSGIGCTDAEHLAKLIIRKGDRIHARVRGVSSMPLRPISASPRAID
jgi:hypothetical protein